MTEQLAPDRDGIERAAAMLAAGRVVAFPTDTVYGLGISASLPERLSALFTLKDRPREKRIPMLVADLRQAMASGSIADERAQRLAERFWPGPLTLVLPAGGSATQAFRAPDHPVALELIRRAGPILATSANRSGEPDTLGADEVLVAFAERQDELHAVVDGGAVPGGVASTVLDLSASPARLLREGPIPREHLEALVEIA